METDQPECGDVRYRIFHVARAPLAAGVTLRPYALGRDCREAAMELTRTRADGLDAVAGLIESHGWPGCKSAGRYPDPLIVLEAAFEWVRTEVAPELPSRLDAVFAWQTETLAREFRDTYQPGGTIHRCRVVAGRQVTRDGALVVAAYESTGLAEPSVHDLLCLERHAACYWRPEAVLRYPEVLVQGTVVVDAIVDKDGTESGGYGSANSTGA